jgi:hypothetical protein
MRALPPTPEHTVNNAQWQRASRQETTILPAGADAALSASFGALHACDFDRAGRMPGPGAIPCSRKEFSLFGWEKFPVPLSRGISRLRVEPPQMRANRGQPGARFLEIPC